MPRRWLDIYGMQKGVLLLILAGIVLFAIAWYNYGDVKSVVTPSSQSSNGVKLDSELGIWRLVEMTKTQRQNTYRMVKVPLIDLI